MIGKIRSTLIGLFLVGSLALGASAVGAAQASVALTAGGFNITSPASDITYPSAPLTGSAFDLTASFTVGVSDATGTGAGWHLNAAIDPLTSGTGASAKTIPAANHILTSGDGVASTGSAPSNSITYPRQIPTSAGSIFNAAQNTGMGNSTVTFGTKLTIPADAAAGSYSATMTVDLISGP